MEAVRLALLAILPALVIVAGLKDLTTMKIPNWISGLLILGFFPAALVIGLAPAAIGLHVGIGVAALLIGLGRSAAVYFAPEFDVLIPYLIMMLVLLVRPQGLFSTVQTRKV